MARSWCGTEPGRAAEGGVGAGAERNVVDAGGSGAEQRAWNGRLAPLDARTGVTAFSAGARIAIGSPARQRTEPGSGFPAREGSDLEAVREDQRGLQAHETRSVIPVGVAGVSRRDGTSADEGHRRSSIREIRTGNIDRHADPAGDPEVTVEEPVGFQPRNPEVVVPTRGISGDDQSTEPVVATGSIRCQKNASGSEVRFRVATTTFQPSGAASSPPTRKSPS